MTDIVDPATRSRMMSGIRGKNTKPEMVVRRRLHAMGFRFRLHDRTLAGSPDIILPKWRACVFVHGCFWHRHEGCQFATTPSTRADFWSEKFSRNVERDRQVAIRLIDAGWRVATVWECALRKNEAATIKQLADWVCSETPDVEIGRPKD